MHTLPVRNYWFPLLLIFFGAVMLLHRLHVIWAGWAPVLWLAVAAGHVWGFIPYTFGNHLMSLGYMRLAKRNGQQRVEGV